ncbi:hypothetical protein CWI69_02090 [Pseudidiomarina halophila]|uniref:Uncharacterized protein n=1 Tax=Pseudidiomarina halophila TaxID=1449799 RepID=A0A432XZS5_9GAMM|nr:hypothetical protein CWI69_02090 [Pseudidiomarina halophila]
MKKFTQKIAQLMINNFLLVAVLFGGLLFVSYHQQAAFNKEYSKALESVQRIKTKIALTLNHS